MSWWFKPKLWTIFALAFLWGIALTLLANAAGGIGIAFAQVSGAAPAIDPASLFGVLAGAIQGKHWGIVVGVVLSAATYALRQWILPKWAWAKTDVGGVVLALAVSAAGTVGTELLTGQVSAWTILDSVAALFLSSGAYSVVHKVLPAVKPAAPPKV